MGKLCSTKAPLYRIFAEFPSMRPAPPTAEASHRARGAVHPGLTCSAERPSRARAPRGRRWGAARMAYFIFSDEPASRNTQLVKRLGARRGRENKKSRMGKIALINRINRSGEWNCVPLRAREGLVAGTRPESVRADLSAPSPLGNAGGRRGGARRKLLFRYKIT